MGGDVGLVQLELVLGSFEALLAGRLTLILVLDGIGDVLSHLHTAGVVLIVVDQRITAAVVSLYSLYLSVCVGNVLSKVLILLETLHCLPEYLWLHGDR